MRNILILAIILLCSITTFSQEYVDPEYNKVLDTSRYVITYEAIMTQDSLNPDEKEYDRIILEIGNNLSRSYSYRLFQYDSLCKTYFDKGRNEYPSPRLLILPVDVYKYFFENKMVVLHRTPLIGPIIQYSEEKNLFKWEMTDEKKDIIGFVCTKATCEFRGRTGQSGLQRNCLFRTDLGNSTDFPDLFLKPKMIKGIILLFALE